MIALEYVEVKLLKLTLSVLKKTLGPKYERLHKRKIKAIIAKHAPRLAVVNFKFFHLLLHKFKDYRNKIYRRRFNRADLPVRSLK